MAAHAAGPVGMRDAMLHARAVQILQTPNVEPVPIAGRLFALELAITAQQHERGLMDRRHLDEDAGMLFIYGYEQQLSFWMANTLIDLDLVYLNDRGRIVSMHTMPTEPPQRRSETSWNYHARLPRYVSNRPAKYAIELRSGMIEELHLDIGDVIALDRARLTQLSRQLNAR